MGYNRGVRRFGSVKEGEVVSIHWDYACDVLTRRQVRNAERYPADDLALMNRYLASRRGS